MNNITGDSRVNFCKKFKVFHNFHQILMATELQFAYMSDRERSICTSFTHMNNS